MCLEFDEQRFTVLYLTRESCQLRSNRVLHCTIAQIQQIEDMSGLLDLHLCPGASLLVVIVGQGKRAIKCRSDGHQSRLCPINELEIVPRNSLLEYHSFSSITTGDRRSKSHRLQQRLNLEIDNHGTYHYLIVSSFPSDRNCRNYTLQLFTSQSDFCKVHVHIANMSAPAGQPAPAGQSAAGNQDYLDKAVDKAEQMIGKRTGHNIDSNKMRSTNEKFTDKLRVWIEKATGKKVPSKFSN
nr:hypothetical protein CFP56_42155 [Quercus suber]